MQAASLKTRSWLTGLVICSKYAKKVAVNQHLYVMVSDPEAREFSNAVKTNFFKVFFFIKIIFLKIFNHYIKAIKNIYLIYF